MNGNSQERVNRKFSKYQMNTRIGEKSSEPANPYGFTYMTVLILVFVTGIALIGVSRYWRTIIKRDLEAELLFRGAQIRNAIASYCKAGKKNPPAYPGQLKDLLKDPRFPGIRRHLRKLYADPLSKDGTWGLILGSKGRIKGVYSKNSGKPIKTGNFSPEFKSFEEAKKYSDWKFIYQPSKLKQGN